MPTPKHNSEQGFTLLELLFAAALGITILSTAVVLFQKASAATEFVASRAILQQNARSAINAISTDISIAGTGLPNGGVALPDTTGANQPVFACDPSKCWVVQNAFLNNHLYAVQPGFNKGLTLGPLTTAVLTVTYVDYSLDLSQYPLTNITPSGSQITVDARTAPSITDPAVGLKVGDLIMLYNANGSAVGVITSLPGANKVNFAASDPLHINQPAAAHGNIASILGGGGGGGVPPTSAARLSVVTYFLDVSPGPDTVLGTADDGPPRLMRQVNAQPPIPIAENIENVQFSYDIFDESTSSSTTNLNDANALPNQIRKVNIVVAARTDVFGRTQRLHHTSLATSVSPRNLSFRDRYQ
jgi:type II secretory pathway pseudopilin PulG